MHSYIDDRKVPQILALSASRVGEWSSHSWKWLTRMRIAILRRVQIEKRLSCRTMRVDQRKAIAALLKVMLSHLDLKTMQVGIYNPETNVFTHLSLNYFAHKAGLSLRRTQRAMAWLYDAGYVIGFRQSSFDTETNEYHHKPSIRRVSNSLLQDLGITSLAIQRARNKSKKNFQKTLLKTLKADTQQSNNSNTVKAVKSMISGIVSRVMPSDVSNNSPPCKAYTEKIKKLMTLMPNLSYEEAKKMLPAPYTYK